MLQVAVLETKLATCDSLRARLDERRAGLDVAVRKGQERAVALEAELNIAQLQVADARKREASLASGNEKLRARLEACEQRGEALIEQLCHAEAALRDSHSMSTKLFSDVGNKTFQYASVDSFVSNVLERQF